MPTLSWQTMTCTSLASHTLVTTFLWFHIGSGSTTRPQRELQFTSGVLPLVCFSSVHSYPDAVLSVLSHSRVQRMHVITGNCVLVLMCIASPRCRIAAP
jgi:hypothetical protein